MSSHAEITRAQVNALLREGAIGASYIRITAWPRTGALTIITDDPARLALAFGMALGSELAYEHTLDTDPDGPECGWRAVAAAASGRVEVLHRLASGLPGELVFPDVTLIEDDSKEIA